MRSGQLYKHLSELPRRLLFPGGHISTVGVGGFTAGGGVGWNNREHGFACDNVIEFRVAVPATDMEPSKVLVCSLEQNQDLFWACRGAARFVGIILEMKVRLYPAPDTIRSLFASVPLNSAHAAWALWKSAVDDTPTSCYPMIVFSTTPDGQKSAVIAMYNFAAEESDRTTVNTAMDALVEGLSALDGCTIMLDGNLPFVEALASQDAFGDVPNQAVYNGSAFVALDKANTQFVDVLLKYVATDACAWLTFSAQSAFPWEFLFIRPICTMCRHFSEVSHARTGIVLAPTCPSPPTDTGVFGDRSNLLWYEILTGWERTEGGPDADGDLQHISWTDGLFSELRTGGFMEVNYMNNSMLLGRDESTAGGVRPRHCFTAEAFERLKSVKAKYDPNGMLAPLDG